MTLAAGMRLGPDEILTALGAGGMGEVYRARDGRLGRIAASPSAGRAGPVQANSPASSKGLSPDGKTVPNP